MVKYGPLPRITMEAETEMVPEPAIEVVPEPSPEVPPVEVEEPEPEKNERSISEKKPKKRLLRINCPMCGWLAHGSRQFQLDHFFPNVRENVFRGGRNIEWFYLDVEEDKEAAQVAEDVQLQIINVAFNCLDEVNRQILYESLKHDIEGE